MFQSMLPLLNDLWQSQDFPDGWKEGTVIPVPKFESDQTNPNNYSPIALSLLSLQNHGAHD